MAVVIRMLLDAVYQGDYSDARQSQGSGQLGQILYDTWAMGCQNHALPKNIPSNPNIYQFSKLTSPECNYTNINLKYIIYN